MAQIVFQVQGTASEPYTVTFSKIDGGLSASCSCPAGQMGQHCKHRVSLLNGDAAGVINSDPAGVETIKSWLVGSPLETALHAVLAADKTLERAKKELLRAKKHLGKTMAGTPNPSN
jgi:uncharacterized Zn finger protein